MGTQRVFKLTLETSHASPPPSILFLAFFSANYPQNIPQSFQHSVPFPDQILRSKSWEASRIQPRQDDKGVKAWVFSPGRAKTVEVLAECAGNTE